MPTPVSTARQCLTDEAARALDEAVAVARRRSHAQTTSLHAVSALLSLQSSALRDACARTRSSAYSSRLQFRALELCVGVSLDRLPSAKAVGDEPPVSNSLMAAIKRSQANQRRHPESFHLQQMHSNQQTASFLKVELKYFILSILDDPIVSRVFGEAGFRSCDIKLAVIHPPVMASASAVTSSPRFSRGRCPPPIFLCNLTDSSSTPDFGHRNMSRFPGFGEDVDANCKRIGELLVEKSGKNPLLVGVCATDALKSFTECVENEKWSVLPTEISGLSVISIEMEVSELVCEEEEEMWGLKFEGIKNKILEKLNNGSGPGVVVSFGELKGLIGEEVSSEAVNFVVLNLTKLFQEHNGKLWLMGAASNYEMYLKFSARFPSIEKDWDLHLLPITSSKPPSLDGFNSKSSLMGSFVPFGGFFSTSEFKNPLTSINQSIMRCHLCNEKYEQEVAAILKVGSTTSVADKYSEKLSPWLQMTEVDTSKVVDLAKTKDDGTTLNAKILALQKKWNDMCQRVHHPQLFPTLGMSQARSQVPTAEGFRFVADRKERNSKDSSPNRSYSANLTAGTHTDLQNIFLSRPRMQIPRVSESENDNFRSKDIVQVSKSRPVGIAGPWFTPYPLPDLSVPREGPSSLSIAPVTTDLGLGTLYASTSQDSNTPKLLDHRERLQHFSGSVSAEVDSVSEIASHQIIRSSSCSAPSLGEQFDSVEYKTLRRTLAEKVGWQDEAILTVSEAISRCRTGNGRRHRLNPRGDIWLTFLGHDKVGKKRIATAVAEIIFGSQERLISVDLSSHDRASKSNSIFKCQELNDYDVEFRGKTVVDYITAELPKRPHSVIFLENVDKADFLAQCSLSQAIRTGKFPDSHGREISINNTIFIMTSTVSKNNKTVLPEKKPTKYSEESILGAKNSQMQLQIGSVSEDAGRNKGMNVRVVSRKDRPNSSSQSVNKRKLNDAIWSTEHELAEQHKRGNKELRSFLDLNLPVEEMEENINCDDNNDDENDSVSEISEAWLEDFLSHVDAKVVFKPFDFDALADELVRQISIQFEKVFGSEVLLEIDHEVILQILAAAWLSDRKKIEGWVNDILSRTLFDVRQKYHPTAQSVIKLVACDGSLVEERAPGVCLPARINLN